MMAKSASNAQQLRDSFRCPKCHGQEAVVRRVSLSTSPIPGFLPLVSGKFHAVTCTLCGYTELYDECAYEKQAEKSDEKLRATQEA